MSLYSETEKSVVGPLCQGDRQRYLLLGIQGAGMQALGQILEDRGQHVTGTDISFSSERLSGPQTPVCRTSMIPWQVESLPINTTDTCVYTPALADNSPLLHAVRAAGIRTQTLHQCLAEIFQATGQICVAGTHGKTTTAAMLSWILQYAKRSPASFVGGELINTSRSGQWDNGRWSVLESCEFSNSFRWFRPQILVLTGIERDHFDCFPDQDAEDHAFSGLASQIPLDGVAIINGDCNRTGRVIRQHVSRVVSFAVAPNGTSAADWQAHEIVVGPHGTSFTCVQGGKSLTIRLRVPGRHNVANAIAAIAAAAEAGVQPAISGQALNEFSGVRRRFEIRGQPNGVTIIDDYAHHPTAIRETIQTARSLYPGRRLLVAFEPHQIARTQALFGDFVDSLMLADETLLLPVFPARESVVYAECCRMSGRLVRELNRHQSKAFLFANLDQIVSRLDHSGRPSDVFIAMGAGRTNLIYDQLTERLRRHSVA